MQQQPMCTPAPGQSRVASAIPSQAAVSFPATTGEWHSMRVKPVHPGAYEVRRRDGAVIDAHFSSDGWDVPSGHASGWRGQVMVVLLAPTDQARAEVLEYRQVLAAYLGNDPMTHASAARAAWRLARRAVSLCENPEAFRFYRVADRIDPEMLDDVDRTWLRRCRAALDIGQIGRVEATVEAYFALRGEADKDGGPASKPTLVAEDLVMAESLFGTYIYHLARKGGEAQSLCGALSMATGVNLSLWGKRGHLNEKYCEACLDVVPAHVASRLGPSD